MSGCKRAHRGPVLPQPASTMAGTLGTSPAASHAKARRLPRSPVPAAATSSSAALTLRELFLAFGGLPLPFPVFVTERKPLGSNRISLVVLAKAGVVLTQFLHAKVTIKKS